MARIKQFADDLGISYNEAKRLIEMGRNTQDSGSSVLDKSRARMEERLNKMKREQNKADRIADEDTNMVLKAKDGKSVTGPTPRPKPGDLNEMVPFDREAFEKGLKNEEMLEEYMRNAPRREAKLKRRGDDKKVVKAAMGTYNTHEGEMIRGMGKAYMGNPRAAKLR
jgi:hypothetical protein